MEFALSRPRMGWRSVPLLLAGLVAGALVLSPAVGEAATFLTKKKADKRYLGNNAVATATAFVPTDEGATIDVLCPSGRQATGGGVDTPILATSSNATYIDESKAIVSGTRSIGWNVEVVNASGNPQPFTAYAVCVP